MTARDQGESPMSHPQGRLSLGIVLLTLAASVAVVTPASPATPARTTVTQGDGLEVSSKSRGTSMQGVAIVPFVQPSGAASPYPIEMQMTSSGTVQDMRVVFFEGISHPRLDDLDLLLVGPHGQQALLMSDAGGDTDLFGTETVTILESATSPLPDEGAIADGGGYRPANYGAEPDAFPAPAPALTGNSHSTSSRGPTSRAPGSCSWWTTRR